MKQKEQIVLFKTNVDIDVVATKISEDETSLTVTKPYRLYYKYNDKMVVVGVLLAPLIQAGAQGASKNGIRIYKQSLCAMVDEVDIDLEKEYRKAISGIVIAPDNSLINNTKN